MPTYYYYAFNFILFLATLSRTSHTQSLDLGTFSSLADPKTSGVFPNSPRWTSSELASVGLLKDSKPEHLTSPGVSEPILRQSSKFSSSPIMPPRKHHQQSRLENEISNEIDDSYNSDALSRYMLVDNLIPNIPLRPYTDNDRVDRFMEKMRKVKAIKEALRLFKKKQRAKLALLKGKAEMHNGKEVRDRDLPGYHRQMKFRRAELLSRGRKFQKNNDPDGFASPLGFLDTAGGFDVNRNDPFHDVTFDNDRPLHLKTPVMFPDQTSKHNLGNFQPMNPLLEQPSGAFFANAHPPKFTQPYDWPPSQPASSNHFQSKLGQHASFSSPSMTSDELGFPKAVGSFSSQFDSFDDSPGEFFEMPVSQHGSSMLHSPSSAFGGYSDGFESFAEPLGPSDKDTQPDPNDGFSTGDVWGEGGFDSNSDDCDIIDTKTCESGLDCNCYGFYTCVDGKCQSKQPSMKAPAAQSPTDGWHERPVVFDFPKRRERLFNGNSRKRRSIKLSSRTSKGDQGKS